MLWLFLVVFQKSVCWQNKDWELKSQKEITGSPLPQGLAEKGVDLSVWGLRVGLGGRAEARGQF